MTDAQKAELAAVAARKELRGLALKEDSSSEDIEAKTKEVDDLEARAAALSASEEEAELVKSEPVGEDAETRELREIRGKARVSDHLAAALTGRGVTGASAEYSDAVGTPGLMPIELLEGPEPEVRAVTPGPASETVTQTKATVPYAFARSDSAALGIVMPTVPSGEAHYPALTTAPPAGPKAEDGAADSTAAAFSLTKRTPGRITGQFVVRVEDLALMPSMKRDLRQGIAGAMANNLDAQVISGTGAGANLSGLFKQATDVAIAGAKEDFQTGVARFAALVDGVHANGWRDIRALIGTATFALYAGLFQQRGEVGLFDYLASKVGLLRVSTRVPSVANSGQKGIAILTAQGQPVTVPVWRGVELIVDPYSQAAKGQRVITAVTLVGSPFIPHGTAQVIEIHPKTA